ncbi:hypothetical protein L1887_24151 [Cichorium endivia]|nr:hypothetical protein L1887_24151 [Cichorium endivia]
MDSRIPVWMLIVCSQVMVIAAVTDQSDVAVLNAIKSSWQNLPPNWSGSDPCGSNWEGINCTNSHVTSLVLAGMGVRTKTIGDIPSLSQLEYIDLSNNKEIKAPLPPTIQNLKNLTTLILVGCNFFGPIPDSIGSLEQLVFLGLNNNSFTGRIPSSIGNLKNLSWLDLSDNQLVGPIPVSNGTTPGLDMLLNAKHFHLANNQLWGVIPFRLLSANMSLIHLILNNNRLSGKIPSSLGLVNTLEAIRLDSNSFDGNMHRNITNLKSVSELYLSNNNLSGPLPNLIGMNSLSYVDMTNNSFDPSNIPTWFTLPSLTTLLMDKTQLQGEIPSDVFQPQLQRLGLSNNALIGTLDVGNSYKNDLIVDLRNNSISDFSQKSGYNISLNLANNPVCVHGQITGEKSSNHGIIIGAAVGGSVILLLIGLAITYAIYQKKQATRAKHSNPFASWALDNGSKVGGVPQLKGARWCSFEELKKCTNNFSEEKLIGVGGYGQVYKGTLDTGHVVAIKRAQQGSLQGAHEFKTEIELLSRIHHKNVVALVGFCYEQGEQMLVYEYISNGTLKDNLSGKAGMRLDWMKRLRAALDSAKGLTYMHELANPPIIHRDIKSTNILLDDNWTAKVADFGLSKLLGDDSKGYVSTQVKGTLFFFPSPTTPRSTSHDLKMPSLLLPHLLSTPIVSRMFAYIKKREIPSTVIPQSQNRFTIIVAITSL